MLEKTEKFGAQLSIRALRGHECEAKNEQNINKIQKTFVKYEIVACANEENDDLMRVSNAYAESLHSMLVLRYIADTLVRYTYYV